MSKRDRGDVIGLMLGAFFAIIAVMIGCLVSFTGASGMWFILAFVFGVLAFATIAATLDTI